MFEGVMCLNVCMPYCTCDGWLVFMYRQSIDKKVALTLSVPEAKVVETSVKEEEEEEEEAGMEEER